MLISTNGRRANNLLVFDLTLLFSPNLQILCIASVTEMIFKCSEGNIRRSKIVVYLFPIPNRARPQVQGENTCQQEPYLLFRYLYSIPKL